MSTYLVPEAAWIPDPSCPFPCKRTASLATLWDLLYAFCENSFCLYLSDGGLDIR